MINDQKYVILSLEVHLFFARIMKEHSLFLEAGFTPKNSDLANSAEHYKKEFEKLLSYAISASNGVIRPEVLKSGELITDYTLGTEQKTQNFTGIEINQNITKLEAKLRSGNNPQVSSKLINYVSELNSNAKKIIKGLINFKQTVLEGVLSCNLFTANYPLLIEHIIREAKLYLSLVEDLDNKVDIDSKGAKETELFWDQIMMEHALFIRGLLDPSENKLIETADEFADDFNELIKEAKAMTDVTIKNTIDETLSQTIELKDFKQAGTEEIASCKIKSIILPLLGDHVLREANHYIRLLESYKSM
ncbi:hypothetical protein C672_0842 [[Clostridium] bifermentans ATCC 638]|uniref:DUF2935 domain-containing protein n=1 Tax=Paraclostridium bifermentans ATCC 638 = DSM 14991 TaxID=1233171 RepID=T4VK86_PARBF|nr:DUF2935 domain-containing protein [Paraclostridium bifermentans]EQK41903.1 hypothetical protein C672_0842 [[Clostridium] bifermentans ATCC 638] [Paraclostridium bifermentans ATCC 638 = DSM 14991]RIZ59223.1 DUF2935 domain-containing protein [Paraclostridium bifermentans]UAG18780.1 DUF2935 domain-containing protein [Paraclostridium bifermentans]